MACWFSLIDGIFERFNGDDGAADRVVWLSD